MPEPTARDWFDSLEGAAPEDQWPVLCFLAGRSVEVDERELNGAIRRAELLLAAGGSPRRAVELDGRATSAVADDLDTPERRAQLRAGLERLRSDAVGFRKTGEALSLLLRDDGFAWQCFAAALLAEELAEET